jgi:hypothetical protein
MTLRMNREPRAKPVKNANSTPRKKQEVTRNVLFMPMA